MPKQIHRFVRSDLGLYLNSLPKLFEMLLVPDKYLLLLILLTSSDLSPASPP